MELGKTFFSHGTNHSRGVLILVKDQLDFKLQSFKVDSQGRYVLLETLIQHFQFALLNIYASNKCADLNVIFGQGLDGSGVIKKTKESVKILEDICLEPSSEIQGQSVGTGERAGRKFSSTGERAPGYRFSPSYFQTFKRMPAPNWAPKMLCIIVPNWRTVSPEFFS